MKRPHSPPFAASAAFVFLAFASSCAHRAAQPPVQAPARETSVESGDGRAVNAPATPVASSRPVNATAGAATPSAPQRPSTASSAAATPPAGDAHLPIARLELANARGESIVLEQDGTVMTSLGAEPMGKILRDGSFVSRDGSLRARLTRDGDVFVGQDRRLPITIDEAGALHLASGSVMRFGADGRLEGGNPSAPETRIIGAKSDTLRTAAFLLILAGFPSKP